MSAISEDRSTGDGHRFVDLVLNQRAHHRFNPHEEVSDADLMTMLTAATHAPSALNTQPWHFIVVRSEESRRAFGAATRARWAATSGAARERNLVSTNLFRELDDGNGQGGLESAPAVIVVCLDTSKIDATHGPSSIYPAVQNLLLSAADLGYGSCMTTGLTGNSTDVVRDRLNLPEYVEPMAAIFVGRPARTLGPPRRIPAELCTHREVFGTRW